MTICWNFNVEPQKAFNSKNNRKLLTSLVVFFNQPSFQRPVIGVLCTYRAIRYRFALSKSAIRLTVKSFKKEPAGLFFSKFSQNKTI